MRSVAAAVVLLAVVGVAVALLYPPEWDFRVERSAEFSTMSTLHKVRALIGNWHVQFEMYPPSDVTRIATSPPVPGATFRPPANRVNAMIESLYQALYWPGYQGDPAWTEDEVRNLDEDMLPRAVNRLGTRDLEEIVDGYGNPLIYFHNADYVKYAGGGAVYLSHDLEGNLIEVEPLPYRNDDGTFLNPKSFQLWSMGPDGKPNTSDDILPLERGT